MALLQNGLQYITITAARRQENYGTPENKARRIKAAADAGMIWPSMKFDVASK